MSKYIDADKMIEDTEVMRQVSDAIMIDGIVKYINDNATADVEEVRHEKWIKLNTGYNVTEVYECSLCGRHLYVDKNTSKDRIQKIAPHCHCGAKMDGGKE